MNILFSSCGRRVELIRHFREALGRHGSGTLVGVDTNPLAPALVEVDRKAIVPRCDSKEFLPVLKQICEKEGIDMLVPLIDPELTVYSESIGLLNSIGTRVLVSCPETVETCLDKVLTARFLEDRNLPFLRTVPVSDGIPESVIRLPAVLKPRCGSGGMDVFTVFEDEEIMSLSRRVHEPILQEKAEGQEITLDCLVDFNGKPLRVVARERLEIRAGESSKGRTVKDGYLTDLTEDLLMNLRACGPVTVQCFRSEGKYVFTEINPRFGGGYPLAHAAGAGFPDIIMSLAQGESVEKDLSAYDEDVYFARFDEAFYLRRDGRNGYRQD